MNDPVLPAEQAWIIGETVEVHTGNIRMQAQHVVSAVDGGINSDPHWLPLQDDVAPAITPVALEYFHDSAMYNAAYG